MPAAGDTQVRFTRSYIFVDPSEHGSIVQRAATNGTVGTWRLSADDDIIDNNPDGPDIGGTVGTARVASDAGGPTKIGQLLYMKPNGEVAPARGDTAATSVVVGVAVTETLIGETVTYATNVIVDIFDTAAVVENDTGGVFAIGADYYLSQNESGKFTYAPDTTTAGKYLVWCGKAVNSNQMLVEIQPRTEI